MRSIVPHNNLIQHGIVPMIKNLTLLHMVCSLPRHTVFTLVLAAVSQVALLDAPWAIVSAGEKCAQG